MFDYSDVIHIYIRAGVTLTIRLAQWYEVLQATRLDYHFKLLHYAFVLFPPLPLQQTQKSLVSELEL
jgi:hypothetical protein